MKSLYKKPNRAVININHIYFLCDPAFNHIAEYFITRYVTGIRCSNAIAKSNYREMFRTDTLLMIFEPLKIDSAYYSIYRLWKRWCKYQAPYLKIIVVGFRNFQNPNYIDLLNLPKDFQLTIDRARPADFNWQVAVEDTGHYSDSLEKMRLFFEGHGRQSLIAQLNKIQQSLNIAQTIAVQEEEHAFEKIAKDLLYRYFIPEWKVMTCRWGNYSKLFEFMPFGPELCSIETSFHRISGFFNARPIQRDKFLKMSLDEKIRIAVHQLKTIDETYIRPEIYES